MFISYGQPEPVPRLGRRVLPWHLAGAFPTQDVEVWGSLTRYAASLDAEATAVDPQTGWVRVLDLHDHRIELSAGLRDQTLLNLSLTQESQGLWTYKSHLYECKDGGLSVVAGFPPPSLENPTGAPTAAIGAWFTFYRATDGSLVALEEANTGVSGGNMVFNKWWRWQRIE